MANLNRTQSRIVPQHKTEAEWSDWLKETGNEDFCPKPGEIIIFDPDDNYNYSRFKIGRQKFEANGQPSKDDNGNLIYYNLSELEFSSGAANGKGQNSLQVGEVGDYATEALGDYSLAVGYSHTVIDGQHPTTTRGIGSVAIGKGNTTYGKQSAAFGCYSITGDKNGTAWNAEGEPFANTDTPGQDLGKNSLAAGYNNNAWGESTVALGTSNIVKGKASLAGGADNVTYSYSSIALGYRNEVGNQNEEFYGHTKGSNGNSARAIAIGSLNTVKHQNSIAFGNNLISAQQNQTIIGKYNKENQDAIMLVGTGTSNDKRHNTISIYDSKVEIQPNISDIESINEVIFETTSNEYTNHSNNLVIKFGKTEPENWSNIAIGNWYYFYFNNNEYYKGYINDVWSGTFDKQNGQNLYAFRIVANNNISYEKMTGSNLTFLKIYNFNIKTPKVEILNDGNILIPYNSQKDATPNRLVTYQELQNVKNGLLGNPEKLSTSYDTISEIADILSNQSGETTTGGLIENVAFLMRGVGSETNDKYANDNAKAPTLSCTFEIGNDIDNNIIGVTLPAGKLNCAASIQEVAEDSNIVSSVTEVIQNTNISSSSNFPWLKSDYSWDGTQITTSGTYYIQFSAEQANTFNFKYYADETSKTKTITKSSSKKPLNFTVYKGTYYGKSASEIENIDLNNFTLALENSMSKKDYTFTCNDEYIYFLEPKGGADLIFEKDGFIGGFNAPTLKTFTNKYGISQEYKVYRSTNKQNGTLTIKVK